MIEVDGQICYSPYPPRDYGRWRGDTVISPAALAIERAYNMKCTAELLEQFGLPSAGMHQWNLMWLLKPEWDDLPYRIQQGERVPFDTPSQADTDWSAKIYGIADEFREGLLKPPQFFFACAEERRLVLPTAMTYNELRKRAGVDVIPENRAHNILSFRRRA